MQQNNPERLDADAAGIARAAGLLAQGGLVAIPTETVYGLAADARNGEAVARIYAAKGRPSFNPLIVHVASLDAAEAIAHFPPLARDIALAFWPGPLTLVLPLQAEAGIAGLVTAGLDTVAVRVPAHPVARSVLDAFDGPVAAPSANPSGRISPTLARHVADGLGGKVSAILDAGQCQIGVESTILAVDGRGARVLRDGGVPREALEAMTGPLVADTSPGKVQAPGQLESHYAPSVAVEIDSALDDPAAVRVGFGPGSEVDLTLSQSGDPIEAAARLFAVLHEADALAKTTGRDRISVAPVPNVGLGRAINDRLRRSAAPRG